MEASGPRYPAAERFYRPILLFGPRRHMNRDRAATSGSGTLMARNEMVGTGNSAVWGFTLSYFNESSITMAQINTYDLHFNTRHSLDFVRFRPENSSHRDRVSSGGIAQG
jgi:hypothetical protein